MEMAILNLAVNARDAMPDGGQIILAGREEVIQPHEQVGLKAGRYVLITLSDTGEGMDAATLQRAMEPFFTTKQPAKERGSDFRWSTAWQSNPAADSN